MFFPLKCTQNTTTKPQGTKTSTKEIKSSFLDQHFYLVDGIGEKEGM